jgi:hypothetical protein
MKCLVGQDQDFELHTISHREPVKLLKDRRYVIKLGRQGVFDI